MDITSYLLGKNASGGGGGGSDLDWTALGYEERPQAIDNGYDYALQIKNNWVSPTTMASKFKDNHQLIFMPLVDTSQANAFSSAFSGCYALEKIALLDTSICTNMQNIFSSCYNLIEIPQFDTSNVTRMDKMFYFCENLTTVPELNTSKLTNMNGAFNGCLKLTNASLNNILKMCINATAYSNTKTLSSIGISDTNVYPNSRIEALPSYQDFIDAGWTIGY